MLFNFVVKLNCLFVFKVHYALWILVPYQIYDMPKTSPTCLGNPFSCWCSLKPKSFNSIKSSLSIFFFQFHCASPLSLYATSPLHWTTFIPPTHPASLSPLHKLYMPPHPKWYPPFSSVQLLSHVRLFATPGTVARQASLSITNSRSLFKLMSIESVMPSNHLIHCRSLVWFRCHFIQESWMTTFPHADHLLAPSKYNFTSLSTHYPVFPSPVYLLQNCQFPDGRKRDFPVNHCTPCLV